MRNKIGRFQFTAVCWGIAVVLAFSGVAMADTVSYTGTLASSDSVELFTLTLSAPSIVTLQTYGFGGGTNAAGTVIPSGGTDPFLAIFAGTGDPATIVTDGVGNPYGTSLDMTNYADFLGCPPAGAPTIGGLPVCGDITMSLLLGPGTYTVALSDGDYIPFAVFVSGTFGDGFVDFTGGNFCNLLINGENCPNTSGAYALDITTSEPTPAVPEPATLALLAGGLGAGWWRKRAKR